VRVLTTDTQVEDLLDHIEQLTARARRQHRELRARQVLDRDGYPTASMGGGTPTSEVDEDGTPLPPRSDPTARTVIDRNQGDDPIGQALTKLIGHLYAMRHQGQLADAVAIEALTPPIKPPKDPTALWCKSCLRANVHTPRADGCGHYCRWCADWRRAHNGELPWVELIDKRQRGIRITPAVIAEVERARKAKKPKRKRSKAKR